MPNPIQILNGNDPVDIGAMLCRGMMEFFINHMPEATAKTQYGNFMAAVEEMLLSPDGIKAVRAGWEKLGEILAFGPTTQVDELDLIKARFEGSQAAIKKILKDMP